jgi:two-component system response regulator VicR
VKRVLVVDDEPVIRHVIEDILRDEGYEVVLASGGHRMLDVLESVVPDLVLLDVMMPEGDGREAARWMQAQQHLRHIPVVMMSAGIAVDQLDTPHRAFLPKPCDLDILLATVQQVIGLPHS